MTDETKALLEQVYHQVHANGDYGTARAIDLLLRGEPLVYIEGGNAHLAEGLSEDQGIVKDWDNEEA